MNNRLNSLQTFNPRETKAEVLEKTLVGRRDLVDGLEELVLESIQGGNKIQRLIIGPRGSGKTHVQKVLHDRIFNNDGLKDKLEIAYLCEDEYGVATFLDWIIRILKSFIRWYPEKANYLKDEIEKLKKAPIDNEKIATQILLNHIKGKTILIIVENIGNIFDKKKGFGKKGQEKFRDLIQQYPYFTIIASNQALFRDVQYEDMPFHNFFRIIHLRKVSLDEAFELLKSIAECDNPDLLALLDTPEGRGRIEAIYDFIGGNHRLLITFYQFLSTNLIKSLSDSFIKTINDLIPYYQSMMEILSSQQQKIVQYMCQYRKPCSVKTIAENCFSAQNTISKQMINLVRLKYVDAIPSGRETYYELHEPLLRICNEIKENRGGPIKLFIDFLGNMHTVEEIKKRYMHYHILAGFSEEQTSLDFQREQSYYKETLIQYFPDKFKHYNIDKFEEKPKDLQIETYIKELEESDSYHEILEFTSKVPQKDRHLRLKEAEAYGKTGSIEKEIETAKLLLKEDKKDIDALLLLAKALQQNKKYKDSNKYFKKMLIINGKNIKALTGLGTNLLLEEKYQDAEDSFIKALDIEPNNITILEDLGIAIGNQKKYKEAYNCFKKLTELQPDYSEVWRLLGKSQEGLEMLEDAKTSYLKAIKLEEKNSDAILSLGILFVNKGEYQQAYNYFEKLTKLQPGYSEGWRLLGQSQQCLEKLEEAKNCYLKAIKLDEKNFYAYIGVASVLAAESNFEKAQLYLEKVLKHDSIDSHTLNSIGDVYRKSEQFKTAITVYEKAKNIDPNNYRPYINLVTCCIGLNQIEKALIQLKETLKKATKSKLTNELIEGFEENHTALYIHASQQNIPLYLNKAIMLIEEHNYTDQFFKSITGTIFKILRLHDKIKENQFEFIEGYLSDKFKENEAMIMPLKFLNVGIRHLKKKEKNALMQFTKEERATFKKFVLDKIQS